MTRRVVPLVVGLVALLAPAPHAQAHVGDDTSYHWVDPPAGIAASEPAAGRTAELSASASGLATSEVWTPDLQVVLAFRATPLPPDPTRSAVELRITPVAPSALAPPVRGAPDGNAYLIELDEPLLEPTSAQISIRLPHEPTALLFSADGAPWTEIELVSTPMGAYAAPFQGNGHYLAVELHPSGRSVLIPILVVGLPAATLLLWSIAAAVARRRAANTPR